MTTRDATLTGHELLAAEAAVRRLAAYYVPRHAVHIARLERALRHHADDLRRALLTVAEAYTMRSPDGDPVPHIAPQGAQQAEDALVIDPRRWRGAWKAGGRYSHHDCVICPTTGVVYRHTGLADADSDGGAPAPANAAWAAAGRPREDDYRVTDIAAYRAAQQAVLEERRTVAAVPLIPADVLSAIEGLPAEAVWLGMVEDAEEDAAPAPAPETNHRRAEA